MNLYAITAIYRFEMARTFRTLVQSIISPVISTVLYFIVFGAALGSGIQTIDNIHYSAFIVPGLIMLTVLMQSVANASFGIYFPKFLGTIYEHLSAPVSFLEITIGYVGAAATKSFIIGVIILATSFLFVPLSISHPVWMLVLLLINCITFSLLGFIIGILSNNFEQLNLVPMLIITPLVFLGGSLYSLDMLPEFWQIVTYFNPVVYLINGLRFSFYGVSDFNIWISVGLMLAFLAICIAIVTSLLKKGYNIKA